MLSMLDRHAVLELLRAGLTLGAIARQVGVSRCTRWPSGGGGWTRVGSRAALKTP